MAVAFIPHGLKSNHRVLLRESLPFFPHTSFEKCCQISRTIFIPIDRDILKIEMECELGFLFRHDRSKFYNFSQQSTTNLNFSKRDLMDLINHHRSSSSANELPANIMLRLIQPECNARNEARFNHRGKPLGRV